MVCWRPSRHTDNCAVLPAGIYAAICAVGFVGILARLPETKGKTLEQIEKELGLCSTICGSKWRTRGD